MSFALVTRTLRPYSVVSRASKTSALAKRMLAPAGMRAYTKIETSVETSQLNPIDFHKYLQGRDREPKEFMAEESEILVSESFSADASLSKDSPSNGPHGNRGVNEEFAKQIHDLLSPSYGE